MSYFLTSGEKVVFVTLDVQPQEIRARAREGGLDIEKFEGERLSFVDCYSAYASEKADAVPSKRTFIVSSYSNLEGIGMAISKASSELRTPVRIFFYTVSTLYLHNSSQAIAKFFQIMTSRVKTHIGFVAYAVQEGVHDAMTMNLLRSLVDGVIEMRFTEEMEREIRVHHLRGLTASTAWVRFSLGGGRFVVEENHAGWTNLRMPLVR